MNFKITTYVLTILLVGALVFAFYMQDQAKQHEAKYEEALIDAEKSAQRIEEMREKLEKALKDSETHRKQAEDALAELQKHKK
jgi:septal ring factor EnvC (AmiA/AmiB activator)